MPTETIAAPNVSPSAAAASGSSRLMSLDALRGFDMLWILGGDALVRALDRMSPNVVTRFFAEQLTHKEWAGFAFYDLIFPLFVFITGVSLVFSLSKELEKHGRSGALKRVFKRSLLLFVLGIIYSGGMNREWPEIRIMGVLQRIAIAYLGASIIYLYVSWRGIIASVAAILVGYWALITFIPVRDISLEKTAIAEVMRQRGTTNVVELFNSTTARVSGSYEAGKNVPNHFDFVYLPGRKHDGHYDPEGVLSHLPAIGTCLLGALAGLLLRNGTIGGSRKVALLVGAGAACVAAGWLWNLQFPVIKKIWTSSYVLVAAGYSAWFLATFYWIIEVKGIRGWTAPFVWVGMNSITVYMARNIIGFGELAERFLGGSARAAFNGIAAGLGDLILALGSLLVAIAFCAWLHRKKIFLRL